MWKIGKSSFDLELEILRNKIKILKMNSESKKIAKIKQEYQGKIEKELTAKSEVLEKEHVVTRAKLVTEIHTLNNQITAMKKEEETIQTELQTLRDVYNFKQDSWIKEKIQIQEKQKGMEKNSRNGNDFERVRLKSTLEETKSELEQVKKEYDVINDQMEYMRRENDELRKKSDDYDFGCRGT